MAARKKSGLLESQEVYVDGILQGLSQTAAAAAAGNSNGSAMASVTRVQEEIARARREIEDLTLLRRVDIIDGILNGIKQAQLIGDPANIIKGWVEIGKILGHYAPEVKHMVVTNSQARIRTKYEALSDEELLAIAEGKEIIDG
ncbi:MAG: hypothetical protein QFB87_05090 [Patescibacteria group bacterium]|nr:hypothetical protein [Patescibacteria group bacterium]